MDQIRSAIEILTLLIPTAKPCLFLTSPLPMLLYHPMHSRLSKWINLMVESNASNAIPKFLNQILTHASGTATEDDIIIWATERLAGHSWRTRIQCLAFKGKMHTGCAHLRAKIVAWPGFSLSKKILWIRSQCWRHLSGVLVMSAFSCQSFTVSWIPLKW